MAAGWPKRGGAGGRPGGGAAAALGVLLLCAAAAAAAGQSGQPGQAILQRGPLPARGIPFFPPNLLPAFRGEYLAEEGRVVVYFTREQVVLPSGWRGVRCAQTPLVRVVNEEDFTLCFVESAEAGYVLFFSFQSESFPWCAWTEAFLQRFRYLLAFTQSSSEVPFPAIFEYRKS